MPLKKTFISINNSKQTLKLSLSLLYILFHFSMVVVTSLKDSSASTTITIGDFVFYSASGSNDQFIQAICDVEQTPLHPICFFHVGIISEYDPIHQTGKLIDASGGGVQERDLSELLKQFSHSTPSVQERFTRLIPMGDSLLKRQAFIELLRTKIGMPYNDIFSPYGYNSQGEKSYYCSQLVTRVGAEFLNEEENELFQLFPLQFKDPMNYKINEYWIEYFKIRGMPVPYGESGSNPSNLYYQDVWEDITPPSSNNNNNISYNNPFFSSLNTTTVKEL